MTDLNGAWMLYKAVGKTLKLSIHTILCDLMAK